MAARRDVNASSRPSGLQRGADDALAGWSAAAAAPSRRRAPIQISLCRRFSASTMNVRTKATVRPSGDIAVSLMVSTR